MAKTKKYTPVARRRDKPDAVYWLILNYPKMTDKQIAKLIGTTTDSVSSIRNKDHWNMSNIIPKDPILYNLCKISELDEVLMKCEMSEIKK